MKFKYQVSAYSDEFGEGERLVHCVGSVIERVAPAVQQKSEPQLPRRVLLQRRADRDEVLQRLGHLAAADRQVTGVQEIAHPVRVTEVRLQRKQMVFMQKEGLALQSVQLLWWLCSSVAQDPVS